MFGNNKPFGTALAIGGAGFSAAAPVGTTVKFNPPTGTDTMRKGGLSTNIQTRHQCITCMKEYEYKSLEELRVEDYAGGRNGGAITGANNAAALQQAHQQILAMTANPFGDSPLFRNSIKDASRETEVLKPTNPSAQKALLNDSQYKVALLPTAKLKPKPWSPSPCRKTSLFDGLEDEEPSLGQAAFLPKKSVKKLVLKHLGANRSTFTVTSDISNASNQNTRIDVSILQNKSDKSPFKVSGGNSKNTLPLTVDISDM